MSANLTDYSANGILNSLFGNGGPFTIQSAAWLAYFNADPGNGGILTGEPSAGQGYARLQVFSTNVNTAVSHFVNNQVQMQWPTANTLQGYIGWWALMPSSGGTDMFMHGAFQSAVTIDLNQAMVIETQAFTITAN